MPGLHPSADGTWGCIYTWYFPYGDLDRTYVDSVAAHGWDVFLANYQFCPGDPGPGLSPQLAAIHYWQNLPLQAPHPWIAPGRALTGREAYLETRGEEAETYREATPFGTLDIRALGSYSVDWGDGTTTGPFDEPGRPWPDGSITHVYIDVGTYNVVVTEQWSATWKLGGAGGTLPGMHTEGRIDNFPVQQIQVVVTPG
ncbi:MAG: hypothetical protein ABR511_13365 [Acidimicrobiales bacterium]